MGLQPAEKFPIILTIGVALSVVVVVISAGIFLAHLLGLASWHR